MLQVDRLFAKERKRSFSSSGEILAIKGNMQRGMSLPLWNLVMEVLKAILEMSDHKTLRYSDDIVLTVQEIFNSTIKERSKMDI